MVALFVIATFLLFFAVDYFVQRAARRREAAVPVGARAPSTGRAVLPEKFLLPRTYFFSRGHAWVQLLFSGKARVGIDDFVQKVIGSIDSIEVVPAMSEVKKGAPLITIRQNGRTLSFPAPISGKVVEVNPVLQRTPELLKKDPYVAGWLAVIDPENIATEIKVLAMAEEAARWLRGEVARFRDFIQSKTPQLALAHAGKTLYDGGVPIGGVLQDADAAVWNDFQETFLRDREDQTTPSNS